MEINLNQAKQTKGRFLRLQTQEPSPYHITSDSRTKAVSKPPLVASESEV